MQQNLISWQCLMESREFSSVFCVVVLLFCCFVGGWVAVITIIRVLCLQMNWRG